MNTASDSRYEVSATFICTGSAPNAFAIVGSAVAMIVESRFCMNMAQATIMAVVRVRLLVRIRGGRAASLIARWSVAPVLLGRKLLRRRSQPSFVFAGAAVD